MSQIEPSLTLHPLAGTKSSMTQIPPFIIPSRLAKTPTQLPKFALPVQSVRGETVHVVDPKATRAMLALMDMEAQLRGAASHYGGPSAVAEIMSALHGLMFDRAKKEKREWYELFNFVNDAGHCENGLYALKANYGFAGLTLNDLKKFRSIESKLTGHGEAHLFPEGVLISNGPLGSGLPQAQGLSVADALSFTKRTTVCVLSDGGAMEGEAKEALAAIPGLARKGKTAPFVLIISDNNTKLTGRIEQDSFSMEPTFKSLEQLGWRVINLPEGHHLQACWLAVGEAIELAEADPSMPVAIHASTIKGKGVKKCEQSASGGHGFPLKSSEELPAFLEEIYSGGVPAEFKAWMGEIQAFEKGQTKAPAAPAEKPGRRLMTATPSEKIQIGVAAAMIKARENGLPVVSVTSDLPGSTGTADFIKKFPEASLDVGVAEANMISTAAGLSIRGYIPFVDTFAQFGVTKGALPIKMANLSQGPVIGIFSHTGFQDAADGASHQALSFYAQVSSIPHVEVISLSSSAEAEALVTLAIEDFAAQRKAGKVPPTRVFFLGRENFPRQLAQPGYKYDLRTSPVVLETEGKSKVTLVAGGSLVGEALKAADILLDAGIGATVIHASSVNHPDIKTISEALKKSDGRLVTVEEHRKVGGLGAMLSLALHENHISVKMRALGIGDEFGQSAYNAIDLYKKHGLDSSAIVKAAKELT